MTTINNRRKSKEHNNALAVESGDGSESSTFLLSQNRQHDVDVDDAKTTMTTIRIGFGNLMTVSKRRSVMTMMAMMTISFVMLMGTISEQNNVHNKIPTSPPRNMIFRGRKERYEKIPEEYRRTFHIPMGTKFRRTVARAFRNRGYRKSDDPETAHFIIDKGEESSRYKKLQPWQRYNSIPGYEAWESKEGFIHGFDLYRKHHPEKTLPFIPETYRLTTKKGRKDFAKRLGDGNGLNVPWVLKIPEVNNGKGVEMLGPNSHELRTVLDRVVKEKDEEDYIIQRYVCNELTWWRNRKFDMRFYWAVASTDPLIVLYHDGYVRVGNSVYNETEFSDNRQHLTTHTFLADEEKGTIDELKELIHYHYHKNARTLKRRIKIDPFVHIRNQFKEIIAETVAAFKNVTFGSDTHHTYKADSGFSLNGIDFVLDNDLDVWYIEAQDSPGLEEEFDFRVELHRDLWRSLIDTVEEIQLKLEKDPTKSVLPLEKAGNWELVYAGAGSDQWMYQYIGYEREQDKKGCSLAQHS